MATHDMTRFGRIAVLYGGTASEREVSLKSGNAVIAALRTLGADVLPVDVHDDFLKVLPTLQFDTAFIALHGMGGEDGRMQALLELAHKSYTGSRVLASAVGMHKLRTKQIWKACDLPTPPFRVLQADSDWSEILAAIGPKVIVKPVCEGSSIGMGIAENAVQLKAAFATASQYDRCVIAESWISGGEYTVAILNGEALPAIRLETANAFYDYEAKYLSNDTRYLCPCGLDTATEQQLQTLALNAFNAVGCEGWGRVDVMRDTQGHFYLLEVNTVPGMTDHSLVPMAAKARGLSFEQLVLQILEGAHD